MVRLARLNRSERIRERTMSSMPTLGSGSSVVRRSSGEFADRRLPVTALTPPSGSAPAGIIDLYSARVAATASTHRVPVVPTLGPELRGPVSADTTLDRTWPLAERGTRRLPRLRRLGLGRAAGALVLAALLSVTSLGGVAAAQQQYVVQDGDTLWSISQQFGVDAAEIQRSDSLSDAPVLFAGEILLVPEPGESLTPGTLDAAADGDFPFASGAYEVAAGDWYQGIADQFGVEVDALLSLNGRSWADELVIGDRLVIPASAADWSGAESEWDGRSAGVDASTPGASAIAYTWVPQYYQQRSLSCEYASVSIATGAFGAGISEYAFDARIPTALNPHYGYRGDIEGWWGGYDDYGIYPEPLVPVLNEFGFGGDVAYTLGETTFLTDHLDAGHPVVVWLALWGDTGQTYDDEGVYTVFAGEHVVVAYAYDDGGVWISDPADATYKYVDWSTFRWSWGKSDGMSLAVYPL